MNLFLIPNLSSTAVSVADPFKVKSKRPKLASKQQWSAWTVNPRTEGIFFSGYEGTTPSVRVSGNNPPWRMHAFIADFDMEVDQREIDTINQRAGVSPNWCCVTQSGHLRVGWEFESPILVHAAVHGRFLKALARELQEELGRPCPIGRPLLGGENFFTFRDCAIHEVCFYYEAELPGEAPATTKDGEIVRWVPLAEFGALDLKLRKAMQLELKRLNLAVGATFVYVTHDQEESRAGFHMDALELGLHGAANAFIKCG